VCSLRDAADQLAAVKTKVYGISLDDVQAQAAFAKAQGVKYALLSDPDGSAAAKYGALMAGRPFSRRVTFVIDDLGVLRAIDDKVDVTNHGADLAKRIGELQRG
jgi:peroxiredoxin Q/BCP